MQQFIRDQDIVTTERLLAWRTRSDVGLEYELFSVRATDRDAYRAAVDQVDGVCWYEVRSIDEESFYVFVCQETREPERAFRDAFASLDVLVVPPIVFGRDGQMTMTILGTQEALSALIDALPSHVDAEILEVGEYHRTLETTIGSLTDRQWAALTAALECGYYDVPRSGSVEDVAASLDCAPSTASQHLRKAESTVVRHVIGDPAGD